MKPVLLFLFLLLSTGIFADPCDTTKPVINAPRTIVADCRPDSVLLSAPVGYKSYLWKPTEDTSSSIYAYGWGDFRVIVTDSNNCTVTSNYISVTKAVKPDFIITVSNDTLIALATGDTPPGKYQWFRNNELLPGETSNMIVDTFIDCGYFSLQFTDTVGCIYNYSQPAPTGKNGSILGPCTGISEVENIAFAGVYPNPSYGEVFIQTQNFSPQLVSIYSFEGKKLAEQKFSAQLNISALSTGIYFIELSDNKITVRKKIIRL